MASLYRRLPTIKTCFPFFFSFFFSFFFKVLVATDRQRLQDSVTPCLRLYSTLWLTASRCSYIICTAYRFIDLVCYVKLFIWHMTALNLFKNNNHYYYHNCYNYHHYQRLIIDAAIVREPTKQIIKYSIFIVSSSATSVLVRLFKAPQLVHPM